MKIRVTMKDPDVLHDAITDALEADPALAELDEDEREAVTELRHDKISRLAGRWFEYGEYLTVEIDTEAESCTVIPRKG